MIIDPTAAAGPFGSTFLGRAGLRVSRLCMGTMTFGAQLNESDSHALLDLAHDRGIDFFDTANAYSGGVSEHILGGWLKGRRDKVVVSTKVRYEVGGDVMSVGLSRRAIKHEVEQSLRRLGTDYIDILYLHQPDYATDPDETLRAMEDLIRAGKVHVLGVSNYAAWQIMQAHGAAARLRVTPPLVVQPMYNLLARGIETELLPCCAALGLSCFVYNPLAAGLLTGKHDFSKGVPPGGRFEVFSYYQDRYWNEQAFKAVKELGEIAGKADRSLIGLSYQWLFQRPGVTGVIIGASSLAQLEENLGSIGEPLDEETMRACDDVWSRLRGPAPAYNR
ncbi:aldo/keto reductase [bacterium]|nr:aldo/keto reductase [candidate division CSSED10-310 bacterium]